MLQYAAVTRPSGSFPAGSPAKIAYQVVTVKPSEVLHGDPAVKEIRLGFIPRESYKHDGSGVPTPAVPW